MTDAEKAAWRAGAEAMQEAAAQVSAAHPVGFESPAPWWLLFRMSLKRIVRAACHGMRKEIADAIRALPLPEPPDA